MRIVIAVGGNALLRESQRGTWAEQLSSARDVARAVVALHEDGHEVILTHGNGPQVGNLLVKNELAAAVVPPVPLDWCVAQTQGTIGALLLDALDGELQRLAPARRVAVQVSRTLVDADDPGLARPTKPIGRYLPADEAAALVAHGQVWQDRGERGWRRVVGSPEPVAMLDTPAVEALLTAGFMVVAAGGGGIPTVRITTPDGAQRLVGVEAVIDKDLTAAVLARDVRANVLVIATDVDAAVLGYGSPAARPLGAVTVHELRAHAADGWFAGGSMGPKVEAACRFVEATGGRSVITSLHRIRAAVDGTAGTQVTT